MFESTDALERLSSADPVPGGGSVAAAGAAMAAALIVMVANLTLGKQKFAAVAEAVERIRGKALGLRDRCVALGVDDEAAYGRVSQAMGLPRGTEEEKATRRQSIQGALKRAAEPPLEVMRASDQVLRLAGELVTIGNPSAISDVGTSALMARAAFHAARLNVEINMASVRDEAWLETMRHRLASFPPVDEQAQQVVDRTESSIRGTGA